MSRLQKSSSSPAWPIKRFAYGAAFYPEQVSRETWLRQLDTMAEAKFTMLRLADSAWGYLEPAPGEYRFDRLAQWIDDCRARGIDCLIATATYITPQWLLSSHPEIVPQPIADGPLTDPIGRRNSCINQPVFREASCRYAGALAAALGGHPGVVGWQLDNEIDNFFVCDCYCPECEKAWTSWLEGRFRSVERLNDELGLHYWTFQAVSLSKVRLPRTVGSEFKAHQVMRLMERLFQRDRILGFLDEQAKVLRKNGARGWMLHDFSGRVDISSDALTEEDLFDLRGNNLYLENVAVEGAIQADVIISNASTFWSSMAAIREHIRSVHGHNAFLCTETSCGAVAGTVFNRKYSTPGQFRFGVLYQVAQGANGILYWSGNAWHGGFSPLWRSLFDFENEPETDFDRFRELGALFARWGETLLAHPPLAEAAFVHDYENRLYGKIYPIHPRREEFLPLATEPLRQLGWGLSGLPRRRLTDAKALSAFKMIILISNPCLDDPRYAEGLQTYVEEGGILVIGPLVNFQEKGGVFRRKGLGANFEGLCGARVRSFRVLGSLDSTGEPHARLHWEDSEEVFSGESEIFAGLCEVLKVSEGAEIIGRLRSADPSLDGAPVAVRKRLGKGTVYRFAGWPADWSRFVSRLAQPSVPFLAAPLPSGVQAVPRTDGSLFILNGLSQSAEVVLSSSLRDRLTGRPVAERQTIEPCGVLWLER